MAQLTTPNTAAFRLGTLIGLYQAAATYWYSNKVPPPAGYRAQLYQPWAVERMGSDWTVISLVYYNFQDHFWWLTLTLIVFNCSIKQKSEIDKNERLFNTRRRSCTLERKLYIYDMIMECIFCGALYWMGLWAPTAKSRGELKLLLL